MRVKFSILLLVCLSGSNAWSQSCAHLGPAASGRCEDLKLVWDLSGCAENKKEKAKVKCSGNQATATLKTPMGQYSVSLTASEQWGETEWQVGEIRFVPVPKRAARKAEVTVARVPSSQEAAIQEKAAPPAENKVQEKQVAVTEEEPKQEPEEKKAEEPDAGDGKLTGNWGGARNSLAKHGITLGAFYSGEVVTNAVGGVSQGTTYMAKATLSLDADLDKLMGMEGWSFHTSGIGMHGRGPSYLTGDAQWTSNIEATPSSRLYDMWLKKEFGESGSSVLFGLYDWNSEFNITESSMPFLNSSFGEGLELSQSPMNGTIIPSTYPYTTMGLRFQVNSQEGYYLQAAVTDGVAGDPNDPLGTHILLSGEDGLFIGTEVGLKRGKEGSEESPGKYVLGVWSYTQTVDTILSAGSTAPERAADYGAYILAEQLVAPNFTVFARYGWANPVVNQITSNLAFGAVWNNPTRAFDNDQFGMGWTTVWNSQQYVDYQAGQGTTVGASESAFELFYRFEPIGGLAIQPDFQYVLSPSMDPTLSNAANFFVRFDLSF
jgi:porin